MSRLGQFLLGGTVSGFAGMIMLRSHMESHRVLLHQVYALASGRKTYEEYDYSSSSPFAPLVDARAWNRLVLDLHLKVLQWWPKPQ
mmetsp:Transcript_80436/g.127005  ORF Transcript_80436/g.127005 Transcript_80436/m.127005 type:complete len:86 (-) Transcript_80436:119-376(-)